ncbi:hypothetical protein D3C86_2112900 [compost metagenome]
MRNAILENLSDFQTLLHTLINFDHLLVRRMDLGLDVLNLRFQKGRELIHLRFGTIRKIL